MFNLDLAKHGAAVKFNGALLDSADFTNATIHISEIGQEIVSFELYGKSFDCPKTLLTIEENDDDE